LESTSNLEMNIQDRAFKMLQAIISESVRRVKNMSDKSYVTSRET